MRGSPHAHGDKCVRHRHGHNPNGDESYHHNSRLRGILLTVFRPHSHDATKSIDAALKTSREGITTLKISVAGLVLTAIFQAIAFSFSGSVSVLGDTIHNFADALTALPLGLAFWLGGRPANKRYTYGYGRSEDIAGVIIIVIVATSSVIAVREAVTRSIHPRPVHQVAWVVVAGLVGFAGNELVAAYRIRVGRKIASAALVADGVHARADGFTSLAVVAGALGVAAGWQLADPIVGLLINLTILLILKDAARTLYRRLMDAVEPELVDEITAVLASSPGIEAVQAVRVRWVGHQLHAEAEIVSDADLTVAGGHGIAEVAHHHLLHRIPRLTKATIHTNPCGHDGHDPHALTSHHSAN